MSILRFKLSQYKDFGISSLHHQVQHGLYNSWHYYCEVNSHFAKRPLPTEITLQNHNQTFSISTADLDPVQQKFVLVGNSNGGFAIYDSSKASINNEFTQIASINRGLETSNSAKYATCVQWYPMDAGLFTSSSCHENTLKVWDPNSMQSVDEFSLTCTPLHHHMSPIASKHSLVAVAGESGEVILCDLRTGSSTHRLHGHQGGGVKVVQWTRHNQNLLASGGNDATIRLWDVRSGKACIKVLSNSKPSKAKKDTRQSLYSPHTYIVSLCFSYDGLWLLSLDSDSQLNLWNTSTWTKLNVKFGQRSIDFRKPVSLEVTQNLYPDLVFVPCREAISVYEVTTGTLVNVLNCHFDSVIGTIYNSRVGELYSYAIDKNFIVWKPRHLVPRDLDEGCDLEATRANVLTQDSWSSDEG